MSDNYITYSEYTTYSTLSLDENLFNKLAVRARLKLDYFTNNRIKKCFDVIPECIKILMCDLINILYQYRYEDSEGDPSGKILTSYSNGIESFGYQAKSTDSQISTEKLVSDKMFMAAKYYLSEYPCLLYRGLR